MAGKLQEYRRIAETAQRQLTGSLERWQSFLTIASRLYKYPYHEQVTRKGRTLPPAPSMMCGTTPCAGMCVAAQRALPSSTSGAI